MAATELDALRAALAELTGVVAAQQAQLDALRGAVVCSGTDPAGQERALVRFDAIRAGEEVGEDPEEKERLERLAATPPERFGEAVFIAGSPPIDLNALFPHPDVARSKLERVPKEP
jgi:hypothetical protein